MMTEEYCRRCGFDTCTCEFYASWPTERQIVRPWLGRRAESFRWGHRTGRADCARRLWPHLTAEGRQLATAIAAEGADADD